MEKPSRRRKRTASSHVSSVQDKYARSNSHNSSRPPSTSLLSSKVEPKVPAEKNDPPSSGVSPLCAFCKDIFDEWDRFFQTGEDAPHYGDFSELKASAANGCSLCLQFVCSVDDGAYYVIASKYGYRTNLDGEVVLLNTVVASDPRDIPAELGRVILHPPGVGSGSRESTFRLELIYPRESRATRLTSLVSMVLVPNSALDLGGGKLCGKIDSNTKESLQACKEWLAGCQDRHLRCKTLSSTFMPTRLVCVRGTPRLVNGNDCPGGRRYATLSHCWGNATFQTLCKNNIADFQKSIPAEALSKTFLDAIFVCRQLEVDYIWIDSLCILQDDQTDWQREASLMTKAYGCSYVNIAASGAADGERGLFFPRPSTWRCRVKVHAAKLKGLYECVPFDMHGGTLRHMPLSRRGWAVQERLLPPRTILFAATQVFWECHEKTASEIFPECYPNELYGDLYSPGRGIFRKEPVQYIAWSQIIDLYTRCALTFEQDKLVAISGLAREVQIHTKDQYLVGLWRNRLERDLCWFTVWPHMESTGPRTFLTSTAPSWNDPLPKSQSSSNPPCTAPSWSWASISTSVNTARHARFSSENSEPQIRVIKTISQPGEDPFGSISTIRLHLSCCFLMKGRVRDVNPEDRDYGRFITDLQVGKETIPFVQMNFSHIMGIDFGNLYFLPVLTFQESNAGTAGPSFRVGFNGLVIQPCGAETGHFRRIGIFEQDNYFEFEVDNWREERREYLSHFDSQVGDEMYSEILEDENGVLQKVIILV